MLAIVISYHKNDKEGYLDKFKDMLKSINFIKHEKSIFITLDGANPSYLLEIVNEFNIPIENIIYSEINVGNYVLKFKLIDMIKNKFKYVKFCDFDDRSCSYNKILKICEFYNDSDLIVCKASKWSCFVNYWDKIYSLRLLSLLPKFKCFTGGDVIISWMTFYLCFKNNLKYSFTGEQIYYKTKEASKTCREKQPEEYLKLETDSNEIKNMLFYCETIESKHIYEKSKDILDIDLVALQKTINLNDFITHLSLHYKF